MKHFLYNFQMDTIRVIYSFTEDDPEDITGLEYHGPTNRGTKSVVLINFSDGDQTLPDDSISMDFLITEVRIPKLFMDATNTSNFNAPWASYSSSSIQALHLGHNLGELQWFPITSPCNRYVLSKGNTPDFIMNSFITSIQHSYMWNPLLGVVLEVMTILPVNKGPRK